MRTMESHWSHIEEHQKIASITQGTLRIASITHGRQKSRQSSTDVSKSLKLIWLRPSRIESHTNRPRILQGATKKQENCWTKVVNTEGKKKFIFIFDTSPKVEKLNESWRFNDWFYRYGSNTMTKFDWMIFPLGILCNLHHICVCMCVSCNFCDYRNLHNLNLIDIWYENDKRRGLFQMWFRIICKELCNQWIQNIQIIGHHSFAAEVAIHLFLKIFLTFIINTFFCNITQLDEGYPFRCHYMHEKEAEKKRG